MLLRADLHLHTQFSEWKHLRILKPRDSYTDPLDAYLACKRAGMDFAAITDHDTIDGALDLLSRHPELQSEVIVGEEVETWFPDTRQRIHVNVFDVTEADHAEIVRLRENVFDLVGWLKRRERLFVLNHPFQSYRFQKPIHEYVDDLLDLFGHFETINAALPARHNDTVDSLLRHARSRRMRRHGVGGSDAHLLRDVAKAWTEAEVPDAEVREAGAKRAFLAAVARGGARAAGASIGSLALTGNVYRIIGLYYLSLRDASVRAAMRPHNLAAAAGLIPVCLAGLPGFLSLGNDLRVEAVTSLLRRHLQRRGATVPAAAPEFLEDPLD